VFLVKEQQQGENMASGSQQRGNRQDAHVTFAGNRRLRYRHADLGSGLDLAGRQPMGQATATMAARWPHHPHDPVKRMKAVTSGAIAPA